MTTQRRRLLAATLCTLVGATAARGADTYSVDQTHSWVAYKIRHMQAASSYGLFKAVDGKFTIDDADPDKCAFAITVKVDGIDSANPARDSHLKGPDFFNAKQFPTISFTSDKVTKASSGGYDVLGKLTMHGVTKEVPVHIEPVALVDNPRGGKVAGFDATFTIKRTDFGMKTMAPMIGDDVTLMVGIEGAKGGPAAKAKR